MNFVNCPTNSVVHVWYYKRPPVINASTTAAEYPPNEICNLIVYKCALETMLYNEDTRVYGNMERKVEMLEAKLKAQQWKNLNYNHQVGGWTDSSSERYEQELELD